MNQEIDNNFTNPSEVQDEELLRHILIGDQEAFRQLYTRHLTTVYKRVAYLIPEDDVEDVTQEVFIAMMRSLKTFKGDSKFSTWLRVITNRQIANYYRKNKQTLKDSHLDQDDARLSRKTAPTTRETQDRRIYIQQSLMEVPDHYREIIMLRFVDGLKFQEIAALQGKSLDAVKSVFRRAIEAMRKELGEHNV
jgi:RNA polymerase sigma-70 factor (ECF subfamily)